MIPASHDTSGLKTSRFEHRIPHVFSTTSPRQTDPLFQLAKVMFETTKRGTTG